MLTKSLNPFNLKFSCPCICFVEIVINERFYETGLFLWEDCMIDLSQFYVPLLILCLCPVSILLFENEKVISCGIMVYTDRIIILVDADCFYCQVEEKLDPSLAGRPIAVVQFNAWRDGG